MRNSRLFRYSLYLGLFLFAFGSMQGYAQSTTDTYVYTGAPEYWTVPICVTTINVTANGAQGGGANGGLGATVIGDIPVTTGDVLEINVGAQGTCDDATVFGGAGSGYLGSGGANAACGGGGATDLRFTPYGLADRVIVAAGGGGMGGGNTDEIGGFGGCATGGTGGTTWGGPGSGATSSAGGAGGPPWGGGSAGASGGFGFGGDGGPDPCFAIGGGGGGGGGYYGGGGGGSDCWSGGSLGGGGGGGGSSLTPGGGTCTAGVWAGNGSMDITYSPAAPIGGTLAAVPDSVCEGDISALTLSGYFGSLQWETAPSAAGPFTPLGAGDTLDTYTTAPLTTTTCFRVEANSCFGMSDWSDTICVVVTAYPSIDAGPDQEICDGDVTSLTAINPDGATISWTGGITDGVPFVPTVGLSSYTVTADINGCISTDDVDILTNSLPIITATSDDSNDEICEYDLITLTATGAGGGTYVWDTGITNGVPFLQVPGVTTHTVTGTDDNGCVNTFSIDITSHVTPTIDFTTSDDLGCEPFWTDFNGTSDQVLSSCVWTWGDGDEYKLCGGPEHTYQDTGWYDVTWSVVDEFGCVNTLTKDDFIRVEKTPIASFEWSPWELVVEETEVQFDNTSQYSTSWTWDFGDLTPQSNEENPSHEYPKEIGDVGYYVRLTAYNAIGCENSTSRIVPVKDIIIFYIPNSFTPDGDQYNETFKPSFWSGIDIYDFHMTIYNKYGEIIFETFDPSSGWDGTYGSRGLVHDGTYIWQLDFKENMSDKRHKHHGHVTILK